MLNINGFVSTSSTSQWKDFCKFRICFQIFGRKPKIFQTNRVNYPVPVHHASTRPLGTKKLPVLNLGRNARNLYDGLKLRAKYTATLLKKTGQNNDTERS